MISAPDTEQTTSIYQTDCLIVGGGMVGAAAALGLAQQGYQVTVLEPDFQQAVNFSGEYDLRISAVTTDNINLLKKLGAWSAIAAQRTQPFNELSVCREGEPWLTVGNAQEPAALGYMIENTVIQHGLFKTMREHSQLTLIEDSLDELNSAKGFAVTGSGETINFQRVVGCDGARSRVRQASAIGVAGREYGQSCLLTVVRMPEQSSARTWERFMANGEIHALLPLAERQACLIVYGSTQTVQTWQYSKEHLQEVLKTRFTADIGEFELLSYGSFPLTRQTALHYIKQRTILLGDAAHTIHPMAGQGVNLGFRDVAKLLAVCERINLLDLDSVQVKLALQQFALSRRADNELMAQAMDSIGWAFGQAPAPVQTIRRLIVSAMQRITPARRLLSAYASGVWKV